MTMPNDALELAACTPVSIGQGEFNPDCSLPYGLTTAHISQSMSDFTEFLGFFNHQLRTRGLDRLEMLLMPANFSSVVGEFINTALPKYCPTLVKNRYHNGHPDLLPLGIYPNHAVLHGEEGIEIKGSRYKSGWQGHNAEAGRHGTSRRTPTASIIKSGYEKLHSNWIYRQRDV